MINFEQYFNEGVRPGVDEKQPHIYEDIEHLDDYISLYNHWFGIDQFRYYPFKCSGVTAIKTMAFRTLKNAARDALKDKQSVLIHYEFEHEDGGSTLSTEHYNDIVNKGILMFRAALRKHNIYKLPTHIITPTSKSPHAHDLGERITKMLDSYVLQLNDMKKRGIISGGSFNQTSYKFMPRALTKSTKSQLFADVFDYNGEVTQDIIDKFLKRYNTDNSYRLQIDNKIINNFIRSDTTSNDYTDIIRNFLYYLSNSNNPLDVEISTPTNIRVGPLGRAHDQNMIGYFKHSEELENELKQPGDKNIWIIDDNISNQSTLNAAESFIRSINPNTKISWMVLIKAV